MGRLSVGVIIAPGILKPRLVTLALMAAAAKLAKEWRQPGIRPFPLVVVSTMLVQEAAMNWGRSLGSYAKCWMHHTYSRGREVGPGMQDAIASQAVIIVWDGYCIATAKAAHLAQEQGARVLVYAPHPGGIVRPLAGPPAVPE